MGSLGGSGAGALRIAALVVAALLQLVALVPFTVASGLLAPLWAVIAFHGLWLIATLVLLRVARRQPLAAPLVPLGYGLLLMLAVTLGERVFGWTG